MKKEQILAEIRRTALANGGTPLGRGQFLVETGIREADWLGKYWVRWGEAVTEAGFSPNTLQPARTDDEMLEKLSALVRELGHYPVVGEVRMKNRSDPTFPNFKTYERFGNKSDQVRALLKFARDRGYAEVVEICEGIASTKVSAEDSGDADGGLTTGFVYLIKHGTRREYKIGRTNNPIRREGEVGIELPLRLEPIHVIETDDPSGVESYWHSRFADKRLNGEWFALDPPDVRAFRRWRKIF